MASVWTPCATSSSARTVSIELRFTDDHKGAAFRQFQTIVCLPDNVAVDTLSVEARDDAGELKLDAMAD